MSDYNEFSLKKSLICVCLAFLIFAFTDNKQVFFVCNGKHSACQVKRVNLLNIPSSKTLCLASDIVGTEVESYKPWWSRRNRYYKVDIIKQSGSRVTVIGDFSFRSRAEHAANIIMSCIKDNNYRCDLKLQ